MRRACIVAAALGLLLPAGAGAKGGVIWDRYPDVQAVGSPMKFTVMQFRQKPIVGVRPLVTFRNPATGQAVRVRASLSDLNGVSYGVARLPSHGPWDTRITVAGRSIMPSDAEPFRVGVGLTQTIPAANAAKPSPATDSDTAGLWLWLTSIAAIGSAVLVFVMRRRGRWGAA